MSTIEYPIWKKENLISEAYYTLPVFLLSDDKIAVFYPLEINEILDLVSSTDYEYNYTILRIIEYFDFEESSSSEDKAHLLEEGGVLRIY